MLKAFTPVSVLIFSFFAGLEKPSWTEVIIVTLICVGVALASYGEALFSLTGFIFQVLGIMCESTRLVLTNVLMKQLKLDPLSSLYYIAPLSAVMIGAACMWFEASDLPFERIFSTEFMVMLLFNGLIAFTLNIAVVMLISNTSALILTLAGWKTNMKSFLFYFQPMLLLSFIGIIKDILLVFLSIMIFGSPVTPLQYFGYGIALIGLNIHKEYKKNPDKVLGLVSYVLCGKS